jgi:hypothetical protein
MAKLFLSYSRKDEAKARRSAEWLEREGHDVWRDQDDIGGGASFSAEIEKALKDCDAVLVLWSAESIRSAWVRDEAGYGRDEGKLIPLSVDGTEPPLGFRQFQSIDVSKWRSGAPHEADRIRQAIARVTDVPQPAPARQSRRSRRTVPQPWLFVGAAIAVAVIALGIFAWQRQSSGGEIAIAVMASPQSSDRAMAADYANVAAADMAAFLPRRFDRATVIGPDEAAGSTSGYRMLISTNSHGPAVDASATLSDQDGHTTLWSQNWSTADASAADLKAEVSAAASKAALCLTDARGGSPRLSQPALGLYLSGCTGLGGTELSNQDFVTIFERVTKLAPDFAPGWGYLGLSRSWIAQGLEDSSPTAYQAAVRSARDAISRARALDPNSALTYDAEYHLIADDSLRALQVLEQGAKVDPNYGMVQMHLSDQLLAVGRMSDSIAAAERAVELEPGAPFVRSQYIHALIYSGEFPKAKADIAKAKGTWPNDPDIEAAEFQLQFRYGDPHVALQLLPRVTDSSDATMIPYQKVIEARLDPTPAQIDAAIAAAEGENGPSARNDLLLDFGTFGRVDQAYQLLEDAHAQSFVRTAILFSPQFAKVRADPRFMQVAARLGLVRYWRQTGFWPDFCSSEKLPYDCKVEAAKYG